MTPRARLSPQTLAVLHALLADPSSWRHGYDLARETTLKSGTLYPILLRLAERNLVEACWEDEQAAGRPRRHLYRLTGGGVAAATAALTSVPGTSAAPRGAAVRRLAGDNS
jgi:DNA-binding PadR family transcriptional regulator